MACIRRPVIGVEDAIDDVQETLDLADEPGLLFELANDAVGRRFAELDAAAGQGPDVADPDRRGDVAEQDPIAIVADDRVRGDARPLARVGRRVGVHGASSAARNRGSSPRLAGTRSPITRPMVARTSGLVASRRAAYSNIARPSEECLDEPGHGVLRGEPPPHRPVVGGEGVGRRVPFVEGSADGPRREVARHERAMEALTGERIEEPRRVPDERASRDRIAA